MASTSKESEKEFEKQTLIHLKVHPKFDLVMDSLVEIFQGLSKDDFSLWAVIAGFICLFSDNTWDVYSLFNLLINSKTAYMSKVVN